jgi:MFS family permease
MQPSRNVVLALCTLVLMLTSAGMTSFSLYLPFIEAEFGWPRSMVTLPYMIAMVTWGISSPLLGKLADDHGARPVILGGIVLMAGGFLGMGLAQDLWQLCLTFGVLVGTAMGAASTVIMSLLVSKHFPPSLRARAVSVVQTASPLNPLVFAPLLFVLIKAADWRVAALATGLLMLVVALPLAWIGARDPDTARLAAHQRAPWSACLPYLHDRPLLILIVARFACGLAFFQTAHLVALTMSKGFDIVAGTTALSVYGACAVAWTLLFGWLADRHSRARVLGLSYAVRGVGTVLLATTAPGELLYYLLVAIAIGPTFGTIAVQNVLFYEGVGPRVAGAMLGLSFIIHQVGAAVGPQIGSVVYDLTRSYDRYQLAIGIMLLASAAMTFNLKVGGGRAPEPTPVTAAAPA